MKERSFDIIISPVYTEKSTRNNELSKYTFKVAKTATKIQIRNAFKDVFNLDVLKVNVLNTKPKSKVFKGVKGVRSSYKKAIVTAPKGKVFEFMSGV